MTEEREEREPTRQERREAKQEKERQFRADNRRSVRITALLSARPKPKGKRWSR